MEREKIIKYIVDLENMINKMFDEITSAEEISPKKSELLLKKLNLMWQHLRNYTVFLFLIDERN